MNLMKIAIFSIATYSNLEEAKVLLDSVFMHASWAQTFIFLAEKSDSLEILKSDTFGHKVVTLSELAIENLNQLAFQYNSEEFTQALKPWSSEYLLKTFDVVIYFDSDIEVFSSLSEIFDEIPKYEAIVTPMITASIPNDEFCPTYTDILRAGQLHSGFFCIRFSPQIKNFLNYWKEQVKSGLSTIDPSNQWIGKDIIFSGILSFVDHIRIIRSKAYHFSAWNAFQRNLSKNQERIITSDGPLVFLNFQGLSRDYEKKLGQKPWVHRSFLPSTKKLRPFLSSDLLADLGKKHKIKKIEARNQLKIRSHAYTFGYYHNGEPIFHNDRRTFLRMNYLEKKYTGNPFSSQKYIKKIDLISIPLKIWKRDGSIVFILKCWEKIIHRLLLIMRRKRSTSIKQITIKIRK